MVFADIGSVARAAGAQIWVSGWTRCDLEREIKERELWGRRPCGCSVGKLCRELLGGVQKSADIVAGEASATVAVDGGRLVGVATVGSKKKPAINAPLPVKGMA